MLRTKAQLVGGARKEEREEREEVFTIFVDYVL